VCLVVCNVCPVLVFQRDLDLGQGDEKGLGVGMARTNRIFFEFLLFLDELDAVGCNLDLLVENAKRWKFQNKKLAAILCDKSIMQYAEVQAL
jgi:hypothetical protein